MAKFKTCFFSVILLAFSVIFANLSAASTLTITVATDKPAYTVEEEINVYGNLTYNNSPVPDRLVAIEVQNPDNSTVVSRTSQTDINGYYNLTFKLPSDAKLGTYTAYVSSSHKGEIATNNTTFELMSAPDIAVINVKPFKTVVGQSFCVKINVTVENQGYFTECFNVAVFYDETFITLQDGKNHTTTTLTSGNSTTLTLTWNTTGVAKSNYILSANATILPGETDTADNTHTNGWILVTIPGDVNGDRFVDMADIDLINYYFGEPCSAYPEADVNCDCMIDMADIDLAIYHFGESW